jgi:hypothetical protein
MPSQVHGTGADEPQQQLHIGVAERFVPAGKAHPALSVEGGELDEWWPLRTSGERARPAPS